MEAVALSLPGQKHSLSSVHHLWDKNRRLSQTMHHLKNIGGTNMQRHALQCSSINLSSYHPFLSLPLENTVGQSTATGVTQGCHQMSLNGGVLPRSEKPNAVYILPVYLFYFFPNKMS